MRADLLLTAGAELGEGPVWDPRTNEVVWVDVLAGQVNRVSLEGKPGTTKTLPSVVGAVASTVEGSWVGAMPTGLCRLHDYSLVAELPNMADDLRMNDGKADPRGRFVGGTMTTGRPRKEAGALWSFDGQQAQLLVGKVTISNGLDWSADGQTMFYIDTPTQSIDAFDYDLATGAVTNRRKWAKILPELGAPDGMCIDIEGGLWVALWGGGAVVRLKNGAITERIEVPTPQVTCPVFAGPNLDQLVITTAATGLDSYSPGAGDLYVCSPGISGNPANNLGSWAN